MRPPELTNGSGEVIKQFVACTLAVLAGSAQAALIDLSTWVPLTLNYPGGQGAGSWVLEPGNTAVRQVINADPSFYRNNVSLGSYSIEGSWKVLPSGAGDDDYMGFAFGYQNSSNFYLFDWKQGTQGYVGRTAAEGMTIKKFTGSTGDGAADLSLEEFWENEVDFGDMDVLATNHSSTAGWILDREYTFRLDFNTTPGQFRIQVRDGATVLWDRTVVDSTFTNGQFAFYNNSQEGVRYAGFTTDVPPLPTPEPGSLALLAVALGSAAAVRRRVARVPT